MALQMKFLPFLLTALLLWAPILRAQDPPITGPLIAQTSEDTRVWVNTASGVYHYPGTRWYGKTKSGKYMTEKEAQAAGYRAAKNGQ
jgi:hypothetical protein